MAREINMPVEVKEPSEAEVNVMGAEACMLAISAKLDDYKRKHGLAQNAGLGMLLLARARTLLQDYASLLATTPETSSPAHEQLIEAVRALYCSAVWVPDRLINGTELWTAVRDAAGFQPGLTDTIPSSGNTVFIVSNKHATMIQSTLDYLQQTDPA